MSIFDPPKSFMDFFARPWAAMPYVVAFLGAMFFIIGGKAWFDNWRFSSVSVPVVVTVVSLDEKRDQKGVVLHRPVFETRVDGAIKSHVANYWSNPPLHQKGEKLDGRFAADSGEIVSDKLLAARVEFGTLFAVTGLILGLGAGLFFVVRWRFT